MLIPLARNLGIAAGIQYRAILERGQTDGEVDTAVLLLRTHKSDRAVPGSPLVHGTNQKRLSPRLTVELGAETNEEIPVRSPREAWKQGLITRALVDDEFLYDSQR